MTKQHEQRQIQRPLRIEQLIDPDRLVQMFEKDAKAPGMSYRLVDIEGNWIGEPGKPDGFCQIMQTTKQGQQFCLQCNRQYLKEAAESRVPIMHKCEAGVVDAFAAIRIGEEVIGYVHGMQVLTEPPSPDQFEKIEELAHRLEMTDQKDAMNAALTGTPIMS